MALDFPSNPVDGQVFDSYYYNAAKAVWKSIYRPTVPNVLNAPTITDATITATATTSSTVPLTVKGATSQSANLQEWKNSAGLNIAIVNSLGDYSSIGRVIGTTPNDSGSTGGVAIKAPAGGTQTSAYLQFVNNAYNAQWGSIEATSAGNMNISTNDLAISGRLKITNQPAFNVQGTGTQSFSGTSAVVKLVMNGTVYTNRGSHYSTVDSRFTAPIAGVYQFSMSAAISTNSTGPEIHLYKNGSMYIPNIAIGYDALYNTFGGQAVISLNANDYVEMFIQNNNSTSFTIDRTRCLFSGFLIG